MSEELDSNVEVNADVVEKVDVKVPEGREVSGVDVDGERDGSESVAEQRMDYIVILG